ncbi:class I SAM-dependent methyltransferase [Herbaspirillum sp. WKF16]|uniref:class I SAM-dependent methyltransferase n=1 Tax=Herbaspirillum sp. WKF16 TaxID=3028312 RepID=UPI0023A992F9|nr:class I SAM-dependent methyltransferase [Herbaspirillum sp. WKF16]WDZ96602.1 class I SAM-dependent methyltransferase [Herbaspirillum sp. WKF16]
MSEKNNTRQSFQDKWEKNTELAFDQTADEGSDIFNWIVTRNGLVDGAGLSAFLNGKKRILDAGCGNGRVTAMLRRYSDPQKTEVVGIDLVAAQIAKANLAGAVNVAFHDKDLLGDLSDIGTFDFIYCQEVLHHTSDPRGAFGNLVGILSDDGEIAIYVYKQKAPVREFVDDFVRDRIAALSYEDAYKACEQITELGKVLSDLKVTVNVPGVDVLGIEAGEYDLQRFIYHFFMKCFWNNEFSKNDNVVINYDWYHPQLCSRHTMEEVLEWFSANQLSVVHAHEDHYGITVRGVRAPR